MRTAILVMISIYPLLGSAQHEYNTDDFRNKLSREIRFPIEAQKESKGLLILAVKRNCSQDVEISLVHCSNALLLSENFSNIESIANKTRFKKKVTYLISIDFIVLDGKNRISKTGDLKEEMNSSIKDLIIMDPITIKVLPPIS